MEHNSPLRKCDYVFEFTDGEKCGKVADHEGAHTTQGMIDMLAKWMGYVPEGAPGNVGPCPTCGDPGHWYHPVSDLMQIKPETDDGT